LIMLHLSIVDQRYCNNRVASITKKMKSEVEWLDRFDHAS
jgi:predicted ribonuclease toxin of YeeF-YezG toxin-antitoxin module